VTVCSQVHSPELTRLPSARRNSLGATLLPIVNVLASITMVFSASMLTPLVLAAFVTHDEALPAFLEAAAAGTLVGGVAWLLTRRYKRELRARHGR
jgi:Trk-type K+ transport system membrane component